MSLGCSGRAAIFALVLFVGALLAGVIAGAVAGPCQAGSLGCYSGVGPFLLLMVVVVVVAMIVAALPWAREQAPMKAGRCTARDRNGFECTLETGHVGPHTASSVIQSWIDEHAPSTEEESAK